MKVCSVWQCQSYIVQGDSNIVVVLHTSHSFREAQKKLRQVLRSKFQKAGNKTEGDNEQEDGDRDFKDDDDEDERKPKKGKGRGKGRSRKPDGGNNKPGKVARGKTPAKSGLDTSAASSKHQQAEKDQAEADMEILEEKAEEAAQKANDDVIETQKRKSMNEGDQDQEEQESPKAPPRRTACKAKSTPKKKKKHAPTPKKKASNSAEPKTPERNKGEGEGGGAVSPKLTPRRQKIKRMKRYQDSPLIYTTYITTVWCL